MSTPPPEKIVVDQRELTFRELGDVEEALGVALAAAFETGQARAMAALAWVTARRTRPDVTFDEVLDWPMGVIEMRQEDDAAGEVPGVSNGAPRQPSPASGP